MIVCYLITMRYGLNLGGPGLNLDMGMGSNSGAPIVPFIPWATQ